MRASAGARAAALRRSMLGGGGGAVGGGVVGLGGAGGGVLGRRTAGRIPPRSLLMQHMASQQQYSQHSQRGSSLGWSGPGAMRTMEASDRIERPTGRVGGPGRVPLQYTAATPPSSLAIMRRRSGSGGAFAVAQAAALRGMSTNVNAMRRAPQSSASTQTDASKPTPTHQGRIKPGRMVNMTALRALTTETVSNKKLSFQVSAAYSAKGDRFEPSAHTFNFNPYNRVSTGQDAATKKRSRPKTGQDAFFVSRLNESGGVALGVADGVGGYSHYGIDSADFSHTLCENMACLAHNSRNGKLHPRTLLHNAYQRLLEEENGVRGGASTACVGTVRPDGVLTVANLGDSGYIILRQGRVLSMSASQTHAFNTPYQLSVVPPEVLDQSRMFGGDFLCDLPKDAQVSTHHLEHGDVVVFATDGVWDNLFTQDVLRIVSQEMISSGAWSSGVTTEKPATTNTTASASLATAGEDSGYESQESATPPPSPSPSPVTVGKGGISPTEELRRLTSGMDGTGLQSSIARSIAGLAKSASLNRRVDGPFAKEVKRLMSGEIFAGGKRDDICVVCLVVVEKESAAAKATAAAAATATVAGRGTTASGMTEMKSVISPPKPGTPQPETPPTPSSPVTPPTPQSPGSP